MIIQHAYTQTIADGGATSVVQPSNWNSAHNFVQNFGGNTTGTSQISGTDLVWAGGNNVTLSANGSTVSIHGPAANAPVTGFWFQPEVYGNTVTLSHTNGTLYLRPIELDGYYDVDRYLFQLYCSTASASTMRMTASVSAGNASSGSGSFGMSGSIYMFSRADTNEVGASYNSIKSFMSNSYSIGCGYYASASWSTNVSSATCSFTTSYGVSFIKNIDGNGGFTTSATGTSGSTSFSSTSTNANSFSSTFVMSAPWAHLSGMRPLFVPAGTNLTPGEYWLGLVQSTASGSTNMSLHQNCQMSNIGMMYFSASSNNYVEIGNSVNMTTSNFRLGFGSYSANVTAAIPLTNVSLMASNASLYFALDGKTQ